MSRSRGFLANAVNADFEFRGSEIQEDTGFGSGGGDPVDEVDIVGWSEGGGASDKDEDAVLDDEVSGESSDDAPPVEDVEGPVPLVTKATFREFDGEGVEIGFPVETGTQGVMDFPSQGHDGFGQSAFQHIGHSAGARVQAGCR